MASAGVPAEGLARSAVEGVGDRVEVVAAVEPGRCLWGGTGAAGRWCSRCCRVARGCAGRRSRCPVGGDGELRVAGHLVPWSQVSERRRVAGRVMIFAQMASRTVAAPRSSGRCSSITNRVLRSTSVPIAEPPCAPMIRSPSQCPGTARSSTSAGRSEIITMSVIRAGGRPVAARPAQRPAGAQARGQLPAQLAPALDVERLVDRLVADPHLLIVGEVHAGRDGRSVLGSTAAGRSACPAHTVAAAGCRPASRSSAGPPAPRPWPARHWPGTGVEGGGQAPASPAVDPSAGTCPPAAAATSDTALDCGPARGRSSRDAAREAERYQPWSSPRPSRSTASRSARVRNRAVGWPTSGVACRHRCAEPQTTGAD